MPILLRNITLAALALASGTAIAHDGTLNVEGCHHDGRNGSYHCHRVGASRSTVQHVAPGRSDSSPGGASGGPADRDCTAGTLACDLVEDTVHGAGRSSATDGAGREERGMKEVLEAGAPSLLVFAVLFVLGLHTIRMAQGRHGQHRD